MPITTLLFATIGIPFLGGLIAAFLPSNARNAEAWLAGAIALIDVAILAFLYPLVTDGNVVRAEIEWIPSAGLNFVVRLDGFAWMFALLIASVGFLVVLYARYYMSPADPVPRLFSFVLAFMGSMLGVVLSGNLVQLVFFWELTSHSTGSRMFIPLKQTIVSRLGKSPLKRWQQTTLTRCATFNRKDHTF